MVFFRVLAVGSVFLMQAALCQTPAATVPSGTPLAVTLPEHLPMKRGQVIRARLVYPIYVDGELVLPKDTIVSGSVVDLRSDHSRRVRAILGGDFTPFHIPEVQFANIVLPDGATVPISAGIAANGTPIYRAVAPPPTTGGLVHRQFDAGVSAARSDVALFLGPGKGDRLLQFVYQQLPWHPQRIEKNTSWTIETSSATVLPAQAAASSPGPPAVARKAHFWEQPSPKPQAAPERSGSWIVQAYLQGTLSSESSKAGDSIRAVVAEPIYTPDHELAVPQGSTLIGAVTRASPARRFGRTGVLSVSFRQLETPGEPVQTVETRLTGADSAQDIALNSEGDAKSKPRDKVSVPLILALLASRPLDHDHHGSGDGNQLGKNGVGGAAGLGLVGTVVGLAGGSPNVAAGIGYWGAARAFYTRWIARGQKITFARDTRIVVETTPRRSAPIKPDL